MTAFGRLPFSLVLGLLATATLGGVAALGVLGFGLWSLAVIPLTAGGGVAYLMEYSQRAPTPPSSPAGDPEEEPFDDPVEEADRASPTAAGATSEPPVGSCAPSPEQPVNSEDELE